MVTSETSTALKKKESPLKPTPLRKIHALELSDEQIEHKVDLIMKDEKYLKPLSRGKYMFFMFVVNFKIICLYLYEKKWEL